MEAQESGEGKIRIEVRQAIDFAEKIISGEYGEHFPDESLNPKKTFSGSVFDENDPGLTPEEIAFFENWIVEKLGSKPDEAPIRAKFKSKDGVTEVIVYDVELGDGWYLSKWQNRGEKPSYIFWPEEVYEWQLEEDAFS